MYENRSLFLRTYSGMSSTLSNNFWILRAARNILALDDLVYNKLLRLHFRVPVFWMTVPVELGPELANVAEAPTAVSASIINELWVLEMKVANELSRKCPILAGNPFQQKLVVPVILVFFTRQRHSRQM